MLQMRWNLSATSEAPPTRQPSTSGQSMMASTVSGVTLPPYWIRTDSDTCSATSAKNESTVAG
eukprot:4991504-Pyramimonas_sp.AAC.1